MDATKAAARQDKRQGEARGTPSDRQLARQTQPIFERIEKETGYPVVAYWNGHGGLICQGDITSLLRLLQGSRQCRQAGLFLRTSGGDVEAAPRCIHILRCHYSRFTAFLPFICASSGTLVALGADEIHMGPGAYLTPVDSTLCHPLCPRDPTDEKETVSISQDQFRRALRLWREKGNGANPFPELYKYIHPAVIGELDRSDALSLRVCQELLSYHIHDKKIARRISESLCLGFPSHSYPIVLREAQRMGLKAKPLAGAVDRSLRELDAIYSRFATHTRKPIGANRQRSVYVSIILERLGMQVYEHHQATMKYRTEDDRWVQWDTQNTRHEHELRNGKWHTNICEIDC